MSLRASGDPIAPQACFEPQEQTGTTDCFTSYRRTFGVSELVGEHLPIHPPCHQGTGRCRSRRGRPLGLPRKIPSTLSKSTLAGIMWLTTLLHGDLAQRFRADLLWELLILSGLMPCFDLFISVR